MRKQQSKRGKKRIYMIYITGYWYVREQWACNSYLSYVSPHNQHATNISALFCALYVCQSACVMLLFLLIKAKLLFRSIEHYFLIVLALLILFPLFSCFSQWSRFLMGNQECGAI